VIDARVRELLALVGLPDASAKFPSQLSGGQRQRIALARALATSPSLLLLDEPLSALDAKERERLRGEIRQLQRRLGVTTVMVTHDQEEALSMSDRVVVMNHGGIEQVGTPLEVYEQPASPFVADFLGKVNVLKATSLGGGRFRVGRVDLVTPARDGRAGEPVRLYLRPEDRILADSGPLDGRQNALAGRVLTVDFHGTYCLANVEVDGFDGQCLLLYCSLNQALELGVREQATLAFAVRGERVRVFPA
jgi:iron(III) transport system ATP-binding protein